VDTSSVVMTMAPRTRAIVLLMIPRTTKRPHVLTKHAGVGIAGPAEAGRYEL